MGGTKIIDQPTFSSIQPRTRFQLHTSEAARIYYEVKQIGDAAYPLQRHKDAIIPRSQRLLFEQQVLMRPSARFRNHNRITYCLNDVLTPHDHNGDGMIQLSGVPPFHVQLSIKNLAASEVYHETVVLNDHTWRLNVPSYTFKSIGPHVVTIESVQDASGCEQAAPDPLFRSIWLDVAETAAIVPFDRKEHYCVGDVSRFQLEGTPPWTIGCVSFYLILCLRRLMATLVTVSMARHIPKKRRSRPFLSSSSSPASSLSHPLLTSRRCARRLSQTCAIPSTRCQPPRSGMVNGLYRIFTRVSILFLSHR